MACPWKLEPPEKEILALGGASNQLDNQLRLPGKVNRRLSLNDRSAFSDRPMNSRVSEVGFEYNVTVRVRAECVIIMSLGDKFPGGGGGKLR